MFESRRMYCRVFKSLTASEIGIVRLSSFILLAMFPVIWGCSYPAFENPIVDPDEAKEYKELFGVYRIEDARSKRVDWYFIGDANEKLPDGFHKIVHVAESAEGAELDSNEFVGFFEKVGDYYVFQIPVLGDTKVDVQADLLEGGFDKESVNGYVIVGFLKTDSGISVGLLNEDFVVSEVEAGNISGRVDTKIDEVSNKHKSVRVTATTEELQAYIKKVPMDSFFQIEELVLKRVR